MLFWKRFTAIMWKKNNLFNQISVVQNMCISSEKRRRGRTNIFLIFFLLRPLFFKYVNLFRLFELFDLFSQGNIAKTFQKFFNLFLISFYKLIPSFNEYTVVTYQLILHFDTFFHKIKPCFEKNYKEVN